MKKHFTLFISDLHLDMSTPSVTETFYRFLQTIAHDADALYILGDFFEAYIGNDNDCDFFKSIKKMLANFTKNGPPVYIMHGNRDFLIDKNFEKDTGVTIISDPTCITLYGKKYLLMHGDSLCTLDKSHQRFRRIMQSRWMKKFLLSRSLNFRKKLAAKLRHESKQGNQQKTKMIMDVFQDAVEKEMLRHQVDTLIHGHTHRCATHHFQLNNAPAVRIVLDDWHAHGQYLKIDDTGHIDSITLK